MEETAAEYLRSRALNSGKVLSVALIARVSGRNRSALQKKFKADRDGFIKIADEVEEKIYG